MAGQGIVPVKLLRQLAADYGKGILSRRGPAVSRALNVLEAKAVELAPVDTGNLEASTATLVTEQGAHTIGTLTFNAPYAATVHELPDYARGPKTRAKSGNEYGPAGPKYLERPLRGMQVVLADIVQRVVFGGES